MTPQPQLSLAILPIALVSGLFASLYGLAARFNDMACAGQIEQRGTKGDLLQAVPDMLADPWRSVPVFALIFVAFSGALVAPFLSRLPLHLTGWIAIAAPMAATLWTVLAGLGHCEPGWAVSHAVQILVLLWAMGGALIGAGRILR